MVNGPIDEALEGFEFDDAFEFSRAYFVVKLLCFSWNFGTLASWMRLAASGFKNPQLR
jgi:hypothetical protein